MDFVKKEKYGFSDLVEVTRILREPGGCPWDREQTHKSIRKNMIEEAYEAVEAIDNGDDENLCEELGDLLYQVSFHSRMAQERGAFDIDDVVDGICKKLIFRHPHIFGEAEAPDAAAAFNVWEAQKDREKNRKGPKEALDGVARTLPALTYAEKIQKKAALYAPDAVPDAASELQRALERLERGERVDIGALLFAAVALARAWEEDPEGELRDHCRAFSENIVRNFIK